MTSRGDKRYAGRTGTSGRARAQFPCKETPAVFRACAGLNGNTGVGLTPATRAQKGHTGFVVVVIHRVSPETKWEQDILLFTHQIIHLAHIKYLPFDSLLGKYQQTSTDVGGTCK